MDLRGMDILGKIVRTAKKHLEEKSGIKLTPKGRKYFGLLAEGKCGECGEQIVIKKVEPIMTDKYPGASNEKEHYLVKGEKSTFACGHTFTGLFSFGAGHGLQTIRWTAGTADKEGVLSYTSTQFLFPRRTEEKKKEDELQLAKNFLNISTLNTPTFIALLLTEGTT
jgi:hypothetical protein